MNSVTTWTIGEEAGTRLDVFLAAQLKVSRGRAAKLVADARINGAEAKASTALRVGDVVEISIEEVEAAPPSTVEFDRTFDVPILFEDDDLIVMNKPRGLVVHRGAGEETETLVEWLRSQGRTLSTVGPEERAGIVHRLDKDTTGIIVACKTDAAHWKMAEGFAIRTIRKTYAALVCGVPPQRGRIEVPIARSPRDRKKMAVVREGRNAITEYVVKRSWPKFALLDVDLQTGRTHQIRVHLSYLHHPVVGDAVYGGRKRALECAPNEAARETLENLHGQALHALRIAFNHPTKDVPLEFEAALPPDFQAVVDALE
ncbi:MAG TPA: RluA family pseudouridine synthase [Abditibacteriaceae bacterium]